MSVSLTVNGKAHTSPAEPETPLLYVLRNDVGLNSAKYGCGIAQCGACTVLVNGAAVRSCVYPVSVAARGEVTTLEGLATDGKLHALQQAFIDEQAAQCGYCASGMIMSAKALLDRVRDPGEDEIRQALAGNLCRCGTHSRILRAVQRAAKTLSAQADGAGEHA
jgi:nicotinate dehydrogenase subunit A